MATNRIGAEIIEMTVREFLSHFDESEFKGLLTRAEDPSVEYLAVFRKDSSVNSNHSAATVCVVGPEGGAFWKLNGVPSLENAIIGETPSEFRYPIGYIRASLIKQRLGEENAGRRDDQDWG